MAAAPEAPNWREPRENLRPLPVFPAGNMLAMLQAENHTLIDRLKEHGEKLV